MSTPTVYLHPSCRYHSGTREAMKIAKHTDRQLVIVHGTKWLLGALFLGTFACGFMVYESVYIAGWAHELTFYTTTLFLMALYGLSITRVTTFIFDREKKTIRWERLGLLPASGSLRFDEVERATLDTKTNRKGIGYHRIVLALDRNTALLLSNARTRDLFLCLDIIETVSIVLGHDSVTALAIGGDASKATRLAETRYGLPQKLAGVYVERIIHPKDEAAPACDPKD